MNDSAPLLFALNASRSFGEDVAARLGTALAEHEEREFEDGEHKARSLVSVRDRDVYVIQSLYSDESSSVNDKLCRLLFFIGALRDASAARITAAVPCLAYARKDRRTQPRDPVTTRYIAALFESVGTDRVVSLDVHNIAAFHNAFRCRTEHLEGAGLFVEYLATQFRDRDRIVVVSPDVGGIKRAGRLRDALQRKLGEEPSSAFFDKERGKGKVSYGRLSGDVEGRHAVIVDDLISTGGTMMHAARECKASGALSVHAIASHGMFVGDAGAVLAGDAIDRLVITDSVAPFRLDRGLIERKVTVLPAAALFAEAIRRMHQGGSLTALLP